MTVTSREAVRAYLTAHPDDPLPWGTLTRLGRKLGVTRERVRQLVRAEGRVVNKRHLGPKNCPTCGRPIRTRLSRIRFCSVSCWSAWCRMHPKHGTSSYYSRGCRCDACRAANTRKMREYMMQPGVRERIASQRRRAYQRPEVRARHREKQARYEASPKGKARRQARKEMGA